MSDGVTFTAYQDDVQINDKDKNKTLIRDRYEGGREYTGSCWLL